MKRFFCIAVTFLLIGTGVFAQRDQQDATQGYGGREVHGRDGTVQDRRDSNDDAARRRQIEAEKEAQRKQEAERQRRQQEAERRQQEAERRQQEAERQQQAGGQRAK